ncbi:hypothetical protein V494_04861 [Pseudogymnoascus sp. VKM F-4513 (FW-928)]|nr:hypothetical protein V494_04861 [Pseudogymnoascus sp. VKM F-4513 (FW-928)]
MTAVTKPTNLDGLVLEAWAQGYMVGSIIIMICITLSNMRRGIALHKIILLELMLGIFHGTFIFTHDPIYGCDPWWVYASCVLLYKIRTQYSFTFFELMYSSPRFAIMLFAMIVSIIFTIIDICAVTGALKSTLPIGINPFWKIAFVFKLLTDSVILDDFKTALDKLSEYNLSRIEDQLGRSWVTSKKNTTTHRERRREPPIPPADRAVSTGESDIVLTWPGIAVLTETKVESYHMSNMGASRMESILVEGRKEADGQSENVVALPHEFIGEQSSGNPFCGNTVTTEYGGKTVYATVVDKCMGCLGHGLNCLPAP